MFLGFVKSFVKSPFTTRSLIVETMRETTIVHGVLCYLLQQHFKLHLILFFKEKHSNISPRLLLFCHFMVRNVLNSQEVRWTYSHLKEEECINKNTCSYIQLRNDSYTITEPPTDVQNLQ